MSLNNIIKPQNPLVNSQGIPLSGGNVYLYEPGTTNFIPSFRDSGLTVPHSNPVRLSGSGRANIWIDRDCDMFIFDRNGNQITESLNANPDNLGSSESGGLVANGSFEIDSNSDTIPDSWVLINFSGSSNAIDTTVSTYGAQSFRFTSSGPGGGTLTTENFFPVNDTDDLGVSFDLYSTLVSVRNIVRVEWYDITQVSISNTDVYDSVTNPVTFTKQEVTATPPALARFAKIKLIGIDPSTPLAGSTYFDNVTVLYPIATISGAFGNLTIQGNEIISTNPNGDINLRPNGTGSVVIDYNGAQVAASVADGLSIRTDIVAATPPTTEAVTGKLSIFDLDGTDTLAFVGFNGSNSALFENLMHGGGIELAGENTSGVRKTILIGDPDADVKLYQAGIEVSRTLTAAAGGFEVNNTLTGGGFERVLTEADVNAKHVGTTAIMTADTTAVLGRYYQCADYATGNNAGVLDFKVVAAGTGTADGGSYIDHDTLPLQCKRIFNYTVSAKDFGAIGTIVADDSAAFSGYFAYLQSDGQVRGQELGVLIPTDFATMQEAVDFFHVSTAYTENTINIIIEDGHLVTSGINARRGDFSRFRITSELGATVKLDPLFVGADTSDVPAGILGETPRQPLFFGYNAKLPQLYCIFDMEGNHGTGIQLAESECTVNTACGVINAGFRGIQIHGRANIYGASFNGAEGAGIRLQQAASCSARNTTADDCCKSEDLTGSAVYASRSSILEFRGGSAQRSGASGLIARRSKVTADEANFDDAGATGVLVENNSEVSFANGSVLNSVSFSINVKANANAYAVGVASSTSSSAKNFNVDVGGVLTVAGSNTVEGVANTEAQTIAQSNVAFTNCFDGDNGMIFFDGGNGTFKITSNANGISQRFADGRMVTYVNESVDTLGLAVGAFSDQLTMPTQPDTFVTVDSSHMTVTGRTTAGGGGSRVCADNYYRGTVLTGSAWRVKNTGQQLDGTSTILVMNAINVSMTTFGTWR